MALDPKIRAKVDAATQDHLEVEDIIEDIVITKSRASAIVIQTNAVNFDLLSETEQDNKILAFAGLLNSLNFHIQILIKTQRIDISKYLKYLKSQKNDTLTPGLKRQLEIYNRFIEKLIVQNDVLDKKFYIVIPFTPNSIPSLGSAGSGLSNKQKAYLVEQGKIFLYPKRDHVVKQLGRMGLVGHQLTNEELVRIFYNTYNPEE